MAIKRSFILSSGIGVSADNLFVVNNTNSVSSTTGSIVLSGGIGIGQSASISGRLQMFNGANYTAFVSSASGNTVYTLPATSPATGSSVLQSTSAGVMSWVPMTATSGSSGLATTAENINTVAASTNTNHHILFSPVNGGSGVAVSSDAGLLFNPASNTLTTNTFSAGVSVNTVVASVSGSTASTSTTSGALIVTGGVGIGQSVSVGGRLQMFNGANFTAFVSSASGNTVYTLPATSPATGTSVLQSTSAGVLSWVAMTSSSSGNTAQNIVVNTAGNANVFHPILFTPDSLSAGSAVSSDGTISFNPSTEILNVSGLAITSTTASTNSTSGALIVTGGVGIGGSLYIAGDLTINGTTTTINSVTLTVDDKNIELGSVVTPSDVTAEGGGITLRGASDKSINWYTGTGWSSSESWNLASGNTYKINNSAIISNSSLGTGVTNSSLTALGTITTGVWSGTSITAFYGGTGLQTTFTVGDILYANTSSTWNRLSPGTNGFILVSAGTANTPAYTNPTTLTIGTATTATNVNVVLASTSASHPLLFTPTSGSASGIAVSSNSTLVYNPSTDILSVSGLAVTSTTASASITTGALVATGGVGIGGSVSVGGRLQMFNAANYTAFVSSATGNTVYTLPDTSPAIGSSVLQSTSAGVMSWVPMTASGNTAQNIVVNTAENANVFHPILFTPSSLSAGSAVSSDSTISFNPSTEILHVSGLAVTSTTSSTSSSTGALVVSGGVGVQGDLFVAANANTKLSIMQSFGDEGGEIFLNKPVTNTTITNGVTIDVFQNRLRIFEQGGSARGFYLDITTGGNGVATNIMGGSSSGTVNSGTATYAAFYPASSNAVSENANLQFTGTGISIGGNIASTSTTSGSLGVYGGVGIGQSVSVGGRLQMFNGANYTAFVSSASGNTVYTLPATSPATGSSVLQSTSAGVMSWVPMTASSSGAGSGTVAIPGAQYQIAGYYSGTGASVSGSTTFTNHTANAVVNISHPTNSTNPSSGALTVFGGVGIGQSVSIIGRLQLFNSSNYTAFVSSATGNTVYTLPATSPATGSSVLQSTSGGLLSWVPMTSGSATPGGSLDGSVQYKSGSGFGGTRSFFFNTTTNGLRLGDFPGEEIPTSNSAALLIEQTISSFNGSVNGTLIGVNSLSSFTGDLINLQINAVTRFKVGTDGGMGVSSLSSSGNVVITSSTNSTSTTTGALVVTGGVGIGGTLNVGADLSISGLTTLTYTSEKLNTKTSATGTVTHDLSTGSVFYHSSISNNFTANFTNVPTTNDRALGVTLILAQGGTPYMSTALQIDGSAQTIKWVNNITPTGTANKVDIVGFSLIRTGSAWTVLGQYSTYG
jgi:hypothetical protein